MNNLIETFINLPENKINHYTSDLLHKLKYSELAKNDFKDYKLKNKEDYTEQQWLNLVRLATILEFKTDEHGDNYWFTSEKLVLDPPWFAQDNIEARIWYVFFSNQVFVKHQCFYGVNDLVVY